MLKILSESDHDLWVHFFYIWEHEDQRFGTKQVLVDMETDWVAHYGTRVTNY